MLRAYFHYEHDGQTVGVYSAADLGAWTLHQKAQRGVADPAKEYKAEQLRAVRVGKVKPLSTAKPKLPAYKPNKVCSLNRQALLRYTADPAWVAAQFKKAA